MIDMYVRKAGLDFLSRARCLKVLSFAAGVLLLCVCLGIRVTIGGGLVHSICFTFFKLVATFSVFSLMPSAGIFPLAGYSFHLYLVHLNVVFVVFTILDFIKMDIFGILFDPGKSLCGIATCYAIVLTVSWWGCCLLVRIVRSRPMLRLVVF